MKNEETLQKQTSKRKPSHRKYIITAGLLLLLSIAFILFAYFDQNEPEPDVLSEALILKEAGWPFGKDPNDITDRDFWRVKEIILGSRNYVDYDPGPIFRIRDFDISELCDIKAIEKLKNLQHLHLDTIRWPKEKIPNWMEFLAKLGILNFDKRFKIDLKPIEKLQYIQVFGIYDTPVSNFESVKNLTYLKSLTLYNTNVSDLEPLKKLKILKNMNIRKCPNISERKIKDLQKAMPDLKITYEK